MRGVEGVEGNGEGEEEDRERGRGEGRVIGEKEMTRYFEHARQQYTQRMLNQAHTNIYV